MLSKRAAGLKPSPTLALAAKAKELKAAGEDVISLSVGEPDWDTFDVIKTAGVTAIKEGLTKYTPAAGNPDLRKSIARQTSQDLDVPFENQQVSVTAGGKFVIFAALQMLCDPGDEVVIPAPYWVSYPAMSELAEAKPVIVECTEDEDFKLTPSKLEAAFTEKTKVLIINSPSNPTGQLYTAQELKSLADVIKRHPRVVVLSDDIYNRLVLDDSGLAPHILQVAPDLKERTLIVNGVSKTYSMTGWRLGWAVGPEPLIQAMSKYQSQSVSCASSITQAAALAAIDKSQDEVKSAVKVLKERCEFVYQALSKVNGFRVNRPQGAFYIWPDIREHLGKQFRGRKLENSRDFSTALLEDQKVVTVPGVEFGLDGYLRISYALSQERMKEAVERIQNFVDEIKS